MATAILTTLSELTVIGENSFELYTYYYEPDTAPYIYNIFITNDTGVYNGVSYVEGYLLANFDNTQINLSIDIDGNLIVTADDAANYSIDSDGNLIYTT